MRILHFYGHLKVERLSGVDLRRKRDPRIEHTACILNEQEIGVIDVALLSIIRRWHLRDQVSLREIARRLRVSRNTVRKYLRTETTEPNYSNRRTPSALDSYAFKLSAWRQQTPEATQNPEADPCGSVLAWV